MLRLALPAVLGVLFATPAPAQSRAADSLIGLWKAQRWFGPEARGPLVIERIGAAFIADMTGAVLPVVHDNGELSFDLPGGQGSFRGRIESGKHIRGHWYPPPSSAVFVGGRFVTPVELRADGPNRWSGEVVPFDDVFSFYLLVRKRPDGSLGALLRNPDRDFGSWLGVERIESEGDLVELFGRRLERIPREEGVIRLFGRRGGGQGGQGGQEEREVARGSYDPGEDVIRLVFPERGGSYDFRRDDEQSAFYPRGKNPARYRYRVPPARDDGWLTGSLDEVGIDRAAIEKFVQMLIEMPMDSIDSPQIHSVLIARRGKLVLEEYFHGEHRDRLHDTRSASKSLTATLIGAAMEAGAPLRASTPVYATMNNGVVPADLDPNKRAMTLEHLLTMSSGFFCDDQNGSAPGNENKMLEQTVEPDYYRYTMRVPLDRRPGERAVYCSADPNMALGVMSRAMKESPLRAFDRLLGAPLGIERYAWFVDPAGNPYGGGGVQLLPRDFIKLGQLMLDQGMWRSRKILSRAFVARASSPLTQISNRPYGYLWWGVEYPYNNRTVRGFAALGAGGQAVIVIPELALVIGSYGANYSSRGWRVFQNELVPRVILPAVR